MSGKSAKAPSVAADSPWEPNEFQKVAAAAYGHGDHAHVLNSRSEAEFRQKLRSIGDTLYEFLMIELAEGPEDPSDRGEVIRCMENAQRHIGDVLTAIEAMPAPPAPKG
jgi:hypothetical protein